MLSAFGEDEARCLLPQDLAEALSTLSLCNRRLPELVRLLNKHTRRAPSRQPRWR